MSSDMFWTNEGFMLDEAGNLIVTSYVDLRAPSDRMAIRTLVKGCHREHALEDSDTILVSPVRRYRTEGKGLILDKNEGLATVETEIVEPETPADAFEHRRLADIDEAVELLDSGLSVTHQRTSRRVSRSSERLSFGKEWWIFSTAIKPETDEEWAAWRDAIDPDYDHVSEIGQPAKFAEALARMVTEQLGPQGKDGWMQVSTGGAGGNTPRTKHPTQWVIHGPVVYSDRLYDTLARDADEATSIAARMFTKSATHFAQREYRFAILRDGAVAEKKSLTMSGMMRDALQLGKSALVRPTPQPSDATVRSEALSSSTNVGTTVRSQHATAKQRVTRRETMRSETRGADGTVSSSESMERERVHESTVIWDPSTSEQEGSRTATLGAKADEGAAAPADGELRPGGMAPEAGAIDEDAVKEIAFGEAASDDEQGRAGEVALLMGTGRADGSLAEMFREMWSNPAFPMPAVSQPWMETKLSREDVLEILGFVVTLEDKVAQVAIENREAASSACWHAIQGVRNIYLRLGAIVDVVSIERERFVVLRLKPSDVFEAAGRIVLGPSGAYAYSFKRPGRSTVGYSEGYAGKMFFPLGQEDTFESHGWPPKHDRRSCSRRKAEHGKSPGESYSRLETQTARPTTRTSSGGRS